MTPEQEEQLISQLPRLFPDYEPVARLGRGAFGAVVAARNRVSGQDVAVKMLGPGHPVADFLREADILGQLSENPHVVRVRYYLERGGQTIIVMERLAGNLVNADLTPADACVVGVAVGHALVAAHGLRILHRDIKPANVLVSEGGIPKVTDFGIAKLFEGTSASATGAAGTYRYMAPEQFSSDRLGPGTDLYALGIMLYELVEGRHPLGLATTAAEWMRAHLDGRPYETSRIPGTVGEVIMSTLAKDRAARPASAAEFVNRLTMAATKDFGRNWLRLSRFRLLPEAIPTDAPVAATLLTSTRRPATASPGLHQSSRPPAVADPGPVVAVSNPEPIGPFRSRHRDRQAPPRGALIKRHTVRPPKPTPAKAPQEAAQKPLPPRPASVRLMFRRNHKLLWLATALFTLAFVAFLPALTFVGRTWWTLLVGFLGGGILYLAAVMSCVFFFEECPGRVGLAQLVAPLAGFLAGAFSWTWSIYVIGTNWWTIVLMMAGSAVIIPAGVMAAFEMWREPGYLEIGQSGVKLRERDLVGRRFGAVKELNWSWISRIWVENDQLLVTYSNQMMTQRMSMQNFLSTSSGGYVLFGFEVRGQPSGQRYLRIMASDVDAALRIYAGNRYSPLRDTRPNSAANAFWYRRGPWP